MIQKARKSASQTKTVVITLAAIALTVYGASFTVGTNVLTQTAQVAGNPGCGTSWQENYKKAQQRLPKGTTGGNEKEWKNLANELNKKQSCRDDKGSTGFCDFPVGSTDVANVCRGDKDAAGNPASDEGLKKAKEAMEKKGGEEKGGGGGGGMPQIPPPPPKKEEPPKEKPQDREGTCPDGEKVFGRCPDEDKDKKATTTPATFLDKMRDAFTGLFGGPEKPGMDVVTATNAHTFEDQLKALERSADPTSPVSRTVEAYIRANKDSGKVSLTGQEFSALWLAAQADPQGAAEEVRKKFPNAPIVNQIIPAGGVFGEGPAGFGDSGVPSSATFVEKVVNTVTNWIKGVFGF